MFSKEADGAFGFLTLIQWAVRELASGHQIITRAAIETSTKKTLTTSSRLPGIRRTLFGTGGGGPDAGDAKSQRRRRPSAQWRHVRFGPGIALRGNTILIIVAARAAIAFATTFFEAEFGRMPRSPGRGCAICAMFEVRVKATEGYAVRAATTKWKVEGTCVIPLECNQPRRNFFKVTASMAALGNISGGLSSVGVAYADALTEAQRNKMTPSEIIAAMKKGNERFRSGVRKNRNYLNEQKARASGQYPQLHC